MFRKILRRFFGEDEEPKTIRSQLIDANDNTIDFLLEDAKISVPRDKIPASEIVQSYALLGTNVVNIRKREKAQQFFTDNEAEFDVYLDTGAVYTIC